jgi:hypothetical protein
VALCAVLSLASGCSALRIGYATAPDIVFWWFDRYVDFNESQSPRVRDAIAQWFAWHRQTQVPEYAGQLAKARTEVLADTTPARVCEWQQEVVKRAHIAFDRFAPAAAELMVTITPEQIRHIERRYEKFNQDFRDDYLQSDPRKRARETLKRVVDRTETLYGKLDDAQRDRIAEALTRSPFDPELWLSERKLRQQDALQILRKVTSEGASRDEAQAALRGYVDRLEHSPRDNYSRYFARLTEFNCAFAANIHNGTSAAQRSTAASRIAGWEGDLRHIAAAAPAAMAADPAGN